MTQPSSVIVACVSWMTSGKCSVVAVSAIISASQAVVSAVVASAQATVSAIISASQASPSVVRSVVCSSAIAWIISAVSTIAPISAKLSY